MKSSAGNDHYEKGESHTQLFIVVIFEKSSRLVPMGYGENTIMKREFAIFHNSLWHAFCH